MKDEENDNDFVVGLFRAKQSFIGGEERTEYAICIFDKKIFSNIFNNDEYLSKNDETKMGVEVNGSIKVCVMACGID